MPLKPQDLRELDTEELRDQAEKLRGRLFELRSRQARKELEGGLEIRNVRRDLARIQTILNERVKGATSA